MSDHSSTESDEMTAENQNQRNLETDSINTILGDFMESREETFEELVNGFLYLTMDDVKISPQQTAAVNHMQMKGSNQEVASRERVVFPDTSESLKTETTRNTTNNNGDTDDIEEEILQDDGACTQISEDVLLRHRPASLTKFDNFLTSEDDGASETDDRPDFEGENNGDEDSDWLPSSGYMASFAAEHSTTDSPEQPASQMSSQPDTKATDSNHSSQPDAAIDSSLIKPTTTPSSQQGAALETSNSECDEFSSDCDAESKLAVWSLNPGEVEEGRESTLPVIQGVNMMEFTMKVVTVADSTENVKSSAADNVEDCNDDVVPFALDEDFDYDNVVYTPKFTQEEMTYLNSFVPKKS